MEVSSRIVNKLYANSFVDDIGGIDELLEVEGIYRIGISCAPRPIIIGAEDGMNAHLIERLKVGRRRRRRRRGCWRERGRPHYWQREFKSCVLGICQAKQ